ncbi:LysE family transporter [Microcoleus sp. FACHB-1515]|uniref:LysE family translocator n=1 Tax=Cyanophyceae TaxID=3028117 RepID=UPI001689AB78|nr:LysE family transporter [Microcoleus sp. FACHB-1515]MBD2088724.1 LysE family transporter [Microcoleus sp. FACHB-1515]
MLWLNEWLTIFTVSFLVISGPGPNFVMTVRNSLGHSRRAGVLTALGLAIGDLLHVAFWLIGLGVLISRSILLFNTLKWLGAAYLIYIGIQALRARPQSAEAVAIDRFPISDLKAIRMGFLTSALNPKVTLFFLALFTQMIRPETPVPVQVIYGLTVASVEFGWFAIVAIVLSQSAIRRRFLAVAHWVERLMGAVLIALGLRLAVQER